MLHNKIIHHGEVLWNFHRMSKPLVKSDFILAIGSHDVRTAEHAAQLFLDGYGDFLVASGGYGKVTGNVWSMTEAEKYKEVIVKLGVSESSVLVENFATNTGDNFLLTMKLLREKGIKVSSGIVVTKPYMCRRAFATGYKQWSDVEWQVTSPDISFLDYPNSEVPFERMMNLMVGDLQRIAIYPKKGFQIEQFIPPEVWESYHYLVSQGFDEFVIK